MQITSVVPSISSNEATLLLGWHSGYGVFVAFDINKHNGQDSHSPSIQVKERVLQDAHQKSFSVYKRENGEIAVAFRPEFLVEYALNAKSLHEYGELDDELLFLNNLNTLSENELVTIKNQERRIIISQIARKYRESSFNKRVLGAYRHQCAVCGVQLQLIDAAHIIPVASDTSTDETRNGMGIRVSLQSSNLLAMVRILMFLGLGMVMSMT